MGLGDGWCQEHKEKGAEGQRSSQMSCAESVPEVEDLRDIEIARSSCTVHSASGHGQSSDIILVVYSAR